MSNKLIAALKENKNDVRKKLVIGVGITVAAVAAAVVLTKIASESETVLVVLEDASESVTDAVAAE